MVAKKKMGLVLENVSKAWHGFALKNINFTVEEDEYFVILGPTGAGKTLLLETIMGFHKLDEGKITLNGFDITNILPEERNIGYVSQNCMLFPHMNVRENIEFGLKMKNVNKTERQRTVDEILDFSNLRSLEYRLPTTLSGGEKQKVTLARILVLKPRIILLDEPLTGVDAETARDIKSDLKSMSSRKIVIHVTHDQIEGFSLGDRLAVMNSGEIVQIGKSKEVFGKPCNTFVASFLGYENIFKAHLIEKEKTVSVMNVNDVRLTVSGNINSPESTIALRPEDISVQPSLIQSDNENNLKGVIVGCIDQGPFVRMIIDTGLMLHVIINKRSFIKENYEVGQEVWVSFSYDAVSVIE